jgi:hypothetical protein
MNRIKQNSFLGTESAARARFFLDGVSYLNEDDFCALMRSGRQVKGASVARNK